MLVEEFDHQWLDGWILEEADTATAGLKTTCFWISI